MGFEPTVLSGLRFLKLGQRDQSTEPNAGQNDAGQSTARQTGLKAANRTAIHSRPSELVTKEVGPEDAAMTLRNTKVHELHLNAKLMAHPP